MLLARGRVGNRYHCNPQCNLPSGLSHGQAPPRTTDQGGGDRRLQRRAQSLVPPARAGRHRACLSLAHSTSRISPYMLIFVQALWTKGWQGESCVICTAGERLVSPHGSTDKGRSCFPWQLSWANR